MPLSYELANMCLLVASIISKKQVVGFETDGPEEELPEARGRPLRCK